MSKSRHNHVTREVKPPGICPACDDIHHLPSLTTSALEAAIYEVLVEQRIAYSTADLDRNGVHETEYLTPLVRELAAAVQAVMASAPPDAAPLSPEERVTLADIVYDGGPSREDYLAGLEHWINTVIAERGARKGHR